MPNLQLGCNWPPIKDKRTIKLSAVIPMGQLSIPSEFDAEVDLMGSVFPARMFKNDDYPCCVISMIANVTRKLEYIEQGHLVNITDQDVEDEWRRQSGGSGGLYMLSAYNEWRNTGWTITNGKLNTAKVKGCWNKLFPKPAPEDTSQRLDIFAWGDLDSPDELRASICYLHNGECAVMLYQKDVDQFNAGEPWHLTGNDGKKVGGHGLDVPAFHKDGTFEDWSWGKRQFMTEDWLMARRYDIKAVVDNRDNFLVNSPVDREKLNALLEQIKNS